MNYPGHTPLHRETPKDVMESLLPMGRPSSVKDITDAVMYLTDAATVTGQILYVDGAAYSDSGYFLLGMIIEKDSGMRYSEFMEDGDSSGLVF